MSNTTLDRTSLIREIVLPNGRKTTNLGFGCASLLRLASRRSRQDLVRSVLDGGIRHFDVARMYGLGAAENELGAALGSHRQQVTIATKFGFPTKGTTPFKTAVQSVGRYALGLLKSLRKGVKKGMASPPRDYSVDGLQTSLETSLSQLGVEHVDMLFYHEARDLADVPTMTTDRLKAYCEQGKIGGYGISTYIDQAMTMRSLADSSPDFHWQLGFRKPSDFRDFLPMSQRDVFGLFGLIGGLAEPCFAGIQKTPDMVPEWSERLGLNLRDYQDFSISVIGALSAMHPHSIILFSTTSPDRLNRILEVLRQPSAAFGEFKVYGDFLKKLCSGDPRA